MALNINGTTGISGVDGSVSAPAVTGTDSNTGITFPSADTIKIATGGVERMSITNSGVSATGHILQVVSATKTDHFTTTAAAASPAAVTGLAVTITPSSTSNKILVMAHIGVTSTTNNDYTSYFYFYKDGSALTGAIGDEVSTTRRVSFSSRSSNKNHNNSASGQFLDSPSSTSALTYQIYCSVQSGGGSATVNRDGDSSQSGDARPSGISTITAMEVAG